MSDGTGLYDDRQADCVAAESIRASSGRGVRASRDQ